MEAGDGRIVVTLLGTGSPNPNFGNADTAIAFVKGGRLRALCHTGKDRLAALPDLPPLSDTLPGFETYEWNGVFVPVGTPRPVVEKLNRVLNETIAAPVVSERLRSADLQAEANTPEQFAGSSGSRARGGTRSSGRRTSGSTRPVGASPHLLCRRAGD